MILRIFGSFWGLGSFIVVVILLHFILEYNWEAVCVFTIFRARFETELLMFLFFIFIFLGKVYSDSLIPWLGRGLADLATFRFGTFGLVTSN